MPERRSSSPGTARFTVGHESHESHDGGPGTPHPFANPGDEPAVLLNTFSPNLRGMIASGRPMTDEVVTEVVTEVMARYATEPATSSPRQPTPTPAPTPPPATPAPAQVVDAL